MEYKQSIIDAKDRKRKTQQDFGRYWRQQMDWNSQVKQDAKAQPYNPDEVWTIEGPTRAAQEKVRREKAIADLKLTLSTQANFYQTAKKDDIKQSLAEGKQLCDEDLAKKNLESQLVAFKKQLFAQEMKDTWEKQCAFKQAMKQAEDLF